MLHPFSPSWLKKASRFSKGVNKFIAYQRDLMPEAKLAEVLKVKEEYDSALKARDRVAIEGTPAEGEKKAGDGLEKKLLKMCEGAVPNYNASPLKENVEVIIVAVIVALGIRAYFLQPFKIPTASMQPTLNGIIATRMEANEDSPNIVKQAWQFAWNGRNYVEFKIPEEWGDDVNLVGYTQQSKLNFFTFTTLYFSNGQQISKYAPARQLLTDLCHLPEVINASREVGTDDTRERVDFGQVIRNQFGVPEHTPGGGLRVNPHPIPMKGGTLFAKGYVESGDQLLVDKVSYHFRRPQRDEVFVFSTGGITAIGKDQHYIKRLTALPGDRLAIEPPDLIINGERATGPGSVRVMSREDGYGGYTYPSGGQGNFVPRGTGARTEEVTLPPKTYMAMGDNSANSFDSRNWGPVPERNLVGPALFVYWPFANHWGLIR
ncbi:MAG TPA: signal peptidase I [Verrucomicrobiales bacterium]|nr:signal peptidase I [Verrucomicrobiales bacterium]